MTELPSSAGPLLARGSARHFSNHLATILVLCITTPVQLLAVEGRRSDSNVHPAGLQTSEVNYRISGEILPEESLLTARMSLTAPPRIWAEGLILDLNAHGLGGDGNRVIEVHSVRTSSGGSVDYAMDGSQLRVEYRPDNVRSELVLDYAIPLDSASVRSLGYFLFDGTGPGQHWYPRLSGPDSTRFADFDVALRYPASVSVLTSGREDTREHADSIVHSRFSARHVEGFALAVGEGYRLVPLERDGLRIIVLTDQEREVQLLEIGEEALRAGLWYRETYGFFPTDHIGIVPGSPSAGGGYPLPNIFMVHLGVANPEFIAWITAHELAHYYWGLYVLDADERLGWLPLANGIWADQLYMADRTGRSLVEQWHYSELFASGLFSRFVELAVLEVAGYESRLGITPSEEAELEFNYDALVRHGKASVGIYLAAQRIGTEAFLELQRGILRDFRYRPLTQEAFLERLEAAGFEDADRFFRRWAEHDARVEYEVARISTGPSDTVWIEVTRRGTIAVPVDVEVVFSDGRRERHTVDEGGDAVLLTGPDFPVAVLLDPDGHLPMWNGAHPSVQSAYLKALNSAGLGRPFLDLAKVHLERQPDDDAIRRLVVARLERTARFGEIAELLPRAEPCRTEHRCRATLVGARALLRLGRSGEAVELLRQVRDSAVELGLSERWTAVWNEIEPADG